MSGCGTPRRSRRTRSSIFERGVVGVEAEMRRQCGCKGRYVDAHGSARWLGGEKEGEKRMSGGGAGRERRDRPCTVDGVCGCPCHECLFAIKKYQLQCRLSRIHTYILI